MLNKRDFNLRLWTPRPHRCIWEVLLRRCQDYDWLFWVDCDLFFMNPTIHPQRHWSHASNIVELNPFQSFPSFSIHFISFPNICASIPIFFISVSFSDRISKLPFSRFARWTPAWISQYLSQRLIDWISSQWTRPWYISNQIQHLHTVSSFRIEEDSWRSDPFSLHKDPASCCFIDSYRFIQRCSKSLPKAWPFGPSASRRLRSQEASLLIAEDGMMPKPLLISIFLLPSSINCMYHPSWKQLLGASSRQGWIAALFSSGTMRGARQHGFYTLWESVSNVSKTLRLFLWIESLRTFWRERLEAELAQEIEPSRRFCMYHFGQDKSCPVCEAFKTQSQLLHRRIRITGWTHFDIKSTQEQKQRRCRMLLALQFLISLWISDPALLHSFALCQWAKSINIPCCRSCCSWEVSRVLWPIRHGSRCDRVVIPSFHAFWVLSF